MLETVIVIGAGIGGFVLARNFVRQRLRFVDAVQRPGAPWVAGLAAALATWPLAVLPFITVGTSLAFGLGTGLGTRSGARAIGRGDRLALRHDRPDL
jgi:hypothetical protein